MAIDDDVELLVVVGVRVTTDFSAGSEHRQVDESQRAPDALEHACERNLALASVRVHALEFAALEAVAAAGRVLGHCSSRARAFSAVSACSSTSSETSSRRCRNAARPM